MAKTHGFAGKKRDRSYRIWKRMRSRCYTESDANYHRYGGRGITMCKEWRESYLTFRIWFLKNDTGIKDCQVDRIDNNKGYSPKNCRLATRKQNLNNTRRSRILLINGEKLTATQASEKYKINYWRLMSRLNRGWDHEDAIRIPKIIGRPAKIN